jgi:hypothetical protein
MSHPCSPISIGVEPKVQRYQKKEVPGKAVSEKKFQVKQTGIVFL